MLRLIIHRPCEYCISPQKAKLKSNFRIQCEINETQYFETVRFDI